MLKGFEWRGAEFGGRLKLCCTRRDSADVVLVQEVSDDEVGVANFFSRCLEALRRVMERVHGSFAEEDEVACLLDEKSTQGSVTKAQLPIPNLFQLSPPVSTRAGMALRIADVVGRAFKCNGCP